MRVSSWIHVLLVGTILFIFTGCGLQSGAAEPPQADAGTFKPGTLYDLHGVDELKAQFNKDVGSPRLIVLAAPTCPKCRAGATWIQQDVLNQYPDANLHIYVDWAKKKPADDRSRWDADVLPDDRAIHFWDEEQAVGRWFADADLEDFGYGPVAKDMYYLFGPDAQWDETPSSLILAERFIVEHKQEFTAAVEPLLTN